MITKLIEEFAEWLKKNAAVKMMRSSDFAEYEIKRLLKTEAEGEIVTEDENSFTAVYKYTFAITPEYSTDNTLHSFDFDVKVIGIKGNVTAQDYEIEDYTELEYIIK